MRDTRTSLLYTSEKDCGEERGEKGGGGAEEGGGGGCRGSPSL